MHKKSAYIQLQQQTLAKNVHYNVHKTSIHWPNTNTLLAAGLDRILSQQPSLYNVQIVLARNFRYVRMQVSQY